MDGLDVLNVISRWLHVSTAIALLGGTIFVRWILVPAAERLSPAEHDQLRADVATRWRKLLMAGIGLFLITGFYNYLVVAVPRHKGDGLYHGLMGTKIILAFVLFFLASVLAGRSPAFESLRRNRRTWLTV